MSYIDETYFKPLKETPLCEHTIISEQTKLILKIDKLELENKQLKESYLSLAKKLTKKVELPERYIINKDATILFWKDGTKTIIRRCADDEFNPRLAFLTAFFQHYCGKSRNKANKYLANLQIEETKEKEKKQRKPKHMKEDT